MKLIVGLGNPGQEYAGQRHNVGFMAVDRIAEAHGFGPWKKRFQGIAADGELGGERVLLLKPQTYMNESGRSVGEAMRFLKIPLADVSVIYDEIDLAPGKLKAKTGGGNAGHNGLRSLTAHVGNDYVRVRIGVGHPGAKDQVVNWVLRDFSKADRDWLDPLLDAIAEFGGLLAKGDQARFLTEIVKRTARDDDDAPARTEGPGGAKPDTPRREPRTSGGGPGAPSERLRKRDTALAENLKKWLTGRKGE